MKEEIKPENMRIHSRTDELIACLEGEIAKRDEELAACHVAVENCEVFRARIAELEARIVWLECEAQVNAAPVSEAKAQGVVMPERKTKADYGVYIDEFADEAAVIYNAALDEVTSLNAATSAPAADACKACKGTGRRPIGGRGRIFGLTNRCFECQPLTAEEVYGTGDSNDQ